MDWPRRGQVPAELILSLTSSIIMVVIVVVVVMIIVLFLYLRCWQLKGYWYTRHAHSDCQTHSSLFHIRVVPI